MIGTVVRIGWINLRRDRVAQAMTFLLPVMFFSIFATVFGGSGRGSMSRVRIAVVDEDRSIASQRLVEALSKEGSLKVVLTVGKSVKGVVAPLLDRAGAEAMVRAGDVPVALVLPAGIGAAIGNFGADASLSAILLADPSDPIAPQVVQGLVQKVVMTAMPDLMVSAGMADLERFGGPLTAQQRTVVDEWLPRLRAPATATNSVAGDNRFGGLLPIEVRDVLGKRDRSLVSFYAAGIGVMFLLFSASGASGSLIEEVESGTLERLLGTRLGMGGLLLGKWLFLTTMGMLQLSVMFGFGVVAFGLDLAGKLPALGLMVTVTAAAAAGFGLVLATACRTRAQLSGISTIVILMMSALGGSMFPRFLMSESLQRVGLFTFNGWALDGFIKVLWREAGPLEVVPQVLVLAGASAVFLFLARRFARRWERA